MAGHSDLRGLIRIMVFQEWRKLNKPHPFADIFRSCTETDTNESIFSCPFDFALLGQQTIEGETTLTGGSLLIFRKKVR